GLEAEVAGRLVTGVCRQDALEGGESEVQAAVRAQLGPFLQLLLDLLVRVLPYERQYASRGSRYGRRGLQGAEDGQGVGREGVAGVVVVVDEALEVQGREDD